MVNALYSSQKGGSKLFTLEGVQFGWQAIIDMYRRECDRRKSGGARMVPKMRESYVLRDAWTKLNVLPAKIMQVGLHITISVFYYVYLLNTQQEHVLTELFHYVSQSPPPSDTPNVKCTLHYLEACNKLFERGLLSHERVTSEKCELLRNIDEGMSFFHKWLNCLKEGLFD